MKPNPRILNFALAIAFSCASIFVGAQDTLRVTIPDLVFELYPAEVEVPVYVDFTGEVKGLQFSLGYDTSFLRLDTVEFSIDGNLPFAGYGEPVLGRIRIVYYTQDVSTFDFNDDSVAMKLKFSVLDSIKAGFSPIDFTDDIGTTFVDEDGVRIPVIRTGGSVVTGLLTPQLSIGTPVANAATDEVCVSLKPDILSSVTGFDFGLSWDTASFKLIQVNTLANPLNLVPEEISFSPTSFRLRRLPGADQPVSASATEGGLVEVCFLGQGSGSYSVLSYVAGDTAFIFRTEDAGEVIVEGSFVDGYLAYETTASEEVRLELRTPYFSDRDSAHCLEVYAANLPPVNHFTFELGWADAGVQLAAYTSLDETLRFDEYGTITASDTGMIVAYQLPGDDVSERIGFESLLKVCLEGPPLLRCTGYDVYLREAEGTPAAFTGRYPVLGEERPLEYAVSDGLTGIPFVDTFHLSLSDTSVLLTEDSLFTVVLTADTEVCLDTLNGFVFAPSIIAELVDYEVLNTAPSVDFVFGVDEWGDAKFIIDKVSEENYAYLPAGDLLKLVFRRILPIDTLPIGLSADGYIYEEGNFDWPWIPISTENGRVAFQDLVSTHSGGVPAEPVSFYPNPTDGEIYFDHEWRGAKLTLFTALGAQLRSLKLKAQRLSLTQLPAGKYFFRLVKDGRHGWGTVIKN